MSGGHFNYFYQQINNFADDIEGEFINDGKYLDDDYSVDIGWNHERAKKEFDRLNQATEQQRLIILKEIKELIIDLRNDAIRSKELEWLLSGDNNPTDYVKRLKSKQLPAGYVGIGNTAFLPLG